MHCWARYLLFGAVTVLGAGQMIAACGQKGDLYLPKEEPVTKPASETTEVPPPAQTAEEQ